MTLEAAEAVVDFGAVEAEVAVTAVVTNAARVDTYHATALSRAVEAQVAVAVLVVVVLAVEVETANVTSAARQVTSRATVAGPAMVVLGAEAAAVETRFVTFCFEFAQTSILLLLTRCSLSLNLCPSAKKRNSIILVLGLIKVFQDLALLIAYFELCGLILA